MSKITLVVAGSFSSYVDWKQKNPDLESKYVHNEYSLLGYPDNNVQVEFTPCADLNPLYNSPALKVFLANHGLSSEHNCYSCNYYYQGICNACHLVDANFLEINICPDWEQKIYNDTIPRKI